MKYLCTLLFTLIGCTPAQKQVMQNDAQVRTYQLYKDVELQRHYCQRLLLHFIFMSTKMKISI